MLGKNDNIHLFHGKEWSPLSTDWSLRGSFSNGRNTGTACVHDELRKHRRGTNRCSIMGKRKAPNAGFLYYTDTLRAQLSLQNIWEHFVERFYNIDGLYIMKRFFLWAIEEWTQETTTLYSSMLCKYFHENEIVFHSRNYKQVTIRFKQMPCRAFRTMDSEKQNHLNKLKKKGGRQQLSFFSKSLVISVIKLIVLKN